MNFLDGAPVLLDAAGNTLVQRGVTMTYNQANRLATVGSLGPFTYNADGQRTTKPAPSGTTVFHYSMDGLLLAETTEAGNLIRVYFWAEDTPIAQMDTALTFLHADHLDTPRIGTNNSGIIVWQWNSDAFGSLLPNEDPDSNGTPTTVNLRFPGQYFDKETGLHYNYFRDYDPRIGRYLESDPIGFVGGLNTFGYVEQNPLSFIDPTGEILFAPIVIGGLIGGGIELGSKLLNNDKEKCGIDSAALIKGTLRGAIPGGFLGNVGRLGMPGKTIGRIIQRSLQGTPFGKGGSINKGPIRLGVGDAPGGTARIRLGLPGKNNKIDLMDRGPR